MINGYENFLFKELLKAESIRTRLVLGVSIFFLVLFFAFFIIYGSSFRGAFQNPYTARFVFLSVIFLVILESLILWRIQYIQKKSRGIPKFRYLGPYILAFIEINIPTFMILIISILEETLVSIYSPAFIIYFIFILLSTLRLEFYLCLFTGTVAALGYFSVGYWLIYVTGFPTELDLIMIEFFHSEKSMLLVMGGLCAGFVASEIRKRIQTTLELQEERNQIERLFGQQVSTEVVQTLLKEPERQSPQKLEVTVMFMDIRNFTAFAEQHPPESIVAFQNTFFGLMIEIINQHNGIVNQILGDGFMATFGAPLSHPYHAQDAVKAGLSMIQGLQELVNKEEIPAIQIGIGLNSGPVIAGNIGNHIRQQYSLTGTTVITAARIEQLTKQFHSQLLISKSVYENIDTERSLFASLGPVAMKGIRQEIEIFQCTEEDS